jgi:hypothetical protein
MKTQTTRPPAIVTPEIITAIRAIERHGIGYIPAGVTVLDYRHAIDALYIDGPSGGRHIATPARRIDGRRFSNYRYFGPDSTRATAPPPRIAGDSINRKIYRSILDISTIDIDTLPDYYPERVYSIEITNVETAVTRLIEFLKTN